MKSVNYHECVWYDKTLGCCMYPDIFSKHPRNPGSCEVELAEEFGIDDMKECDFFH